MEARGFTGTKDRTYYQTAGLSGKDFVYFAGLASVAAGILLTFKKVLQGRLAALYKPGYRRAFCKMQTFRTLTEIY